MVTKAIWDAICSFLAFLMGLIPTIDTPSWVHDVNTYAVQGVETANGFHNWIPIVALGNAFVFLMACGAVVFGVRTFRILLSLFTGGGGGAA